MSKLILPSNYVDVCDDEVEYVGGGTPDWTKPSSYFMLAACVALCFVSPPAAVILTTLFFIFY